MDPCQEESSSEVPQLHKGLDCLNFYKDCAIFITISLTSIKLFFSVDVPF